MPYKVFVSYSSRDLTHAATIKENLKAAGAEVFVAEYSLPAGSQLTDKILSEIRSADLFVVLWSEDAKKSDWVTQEVGVAKAHEKPIIPLLLQKGLDVSGFLTGTKYLAAHEDPAAAHAWLQKHVMGRVAQKSTTEAWVLVGVLGVLLLALSKGK